MSGRTFKDIIRDDISKTFINLNEFAEEKLIDGVPMRVIIDTNELEERQKSTVADRSTDGIYKAAILIYIPVEDYGPKPKPGKLLNIDNRKTYIIKSCINEDGIYSMVLEAARS